MTDRLLGEFGRGSQTHRLRTTTYDGNPRRYVSLAEQAGDEWDRVGYAELHPHVTDEREGLLAETGAVLEWSGPFSHRRHHQHRLVVERPAAGELAVRHEHGVTDRYDNQSSERPGPDEAPEWELQEGWRVTPDEVVALDEQVRADGGQSSDGMGQYETSVWDRHEGNDEQVPEFCPHCGEQLAHPDDMKENDDLSRNPGFLAAYRKHRQAHYEWGVDPATVYPGGDPYLDDYYDDNPGKGSRDKDEIVAKEFDVEIKYEATMRATVVAANESQAKERAQELRGHGKDLTGNVPEPHISLEVHDDVRERTELTRREVENSAEVDEDEEDGINYADRLPGWPW